MQYGCRMAAVVPFQPSGSDGPSKLQITLGVEAAQLTRRLAEQRSVSNAEIIRRGLMLMEWIDSLAPGEQVLVRSADASTIERVRFNWSI